MEPVEGLIAIDNVNATLEEEEDKEFEVCFSNTFQHSGNRLMTSFHLSIRLPHCMSISYLIVELVISSAIK